MRTKLYYTVVINEIDKLLEYLDGGRIPDIKQYIDGEIKQAEEYYWCALDCYEDTEFRLVTEQLSTRMRHILEDRLEMAAADVDKYGDLNRFYSDLKRIIDNHNYTAATIHWYLELYRDYINDEYKLLYEDIEDIIGDEDYED